MTKSGIGTLQHQNMFTNTNANNLSAPSSQPQTPTPVSSSSLIANAEIPIWVADKKKWVTGISKKTTINDLIFAILKQCQIAPKNKTFLQNECESLSSQYVLVEYNFESANTTPDELNTEQQIILTSQRILNGDSKVYKFLAKWSFSGQYPTQQPNNLMLKILQKQVLEEKIEPAGLVTDPITATSISFNNSNDLQKNTSLATKLLKKFGVTSSSSSGTLSNNITKSTSSSLSTNNPVPAYRYIDVKLPTLAHQPSLLSQQNKNVNQISPVSTTSSNSLTKQQHHRNFDPTIQKSFITNSILEKDGKLKQQIKRFQLIDELIKETQKKSKSTNSTSRFFETNVANPMYNYSQLQMTTTPVEVTNIYETTNLTPTDSKKLFNIVDLNDIYCHFPEMSTHHSKEVEDFTVMCSQLFQLEEAIKSQKQILSALELDLQRELQPNQIVLENNNIATQNSFLNNETTTPETEELRKEVNYSREQTRLQCKQLHDLDMCMKQNDQNLMTKEQELQNLLEELYIQEIYADNAIESAIISTANRPTTPSGQLHLNMSTFKLNNSSSPSSINNVMNGNSKNNSVINLQHESSLNLTGGGSGFPNETIDSFENENNCTQDRAELIINENKSLNVDFTNMHQQKKITIEKFNTLENQNKRHIKTFNENHYGEDISINNIVEQKKPQSIKILNQISNQSPTNENGNQNLYQQHLHCQQKSLSNGNLSGNQANPTHNLYYSSPSNSPQNNNNIKKFQITNTKLICSQENEINHGHSLNAHMKNLKLTQNHQFINSQSKVGGMSNNNNSNGDHSGGDNDSGISSMSSETAAAITSALNSNLSLQNSMNYIQKPVIMGKQQRNHLFINNQQFNGQQYFLSNHQIFQTGENNGSQANKSIHSQTNSSVSTQSKSVLETLV